MPKKAASSSSAASPRAKSSRAKAEPVADGAAMDVTLAGKTPTRKTSVPPKTKVAAKAATQPIEITREMIAERAYHLWLEGTPGGEFDHWCAAERQLRGV